MGKFTGAARTSAIAKHDVSTFDDVVTPGLDRDLLLVYRKPVDSSAVIDGAVSFSVDVRSGALPCACQWQVCKTLMNKDGSHMLDKDGQVDVR